jgi:hypothetical protein
MLKMQRQNPAYRFPFFFSILAQQGSIHEKIPTSSFYLRFSHDPISTL